MTAEPEPSGREPGRVAAPGRVMRRPVAAVVSLGWGLAVGGTFGVLLPWLLGYWHLHRPLPGWAIAQTAGAVLLCVGVIPVVQSFIDFAASDGTPVPVAAPPCLVVRGFYRYVRNPIYVGFVAVLLGETMITGSLGLLKYTAIAWCVGAAGVRFYEEPVLARKFGAEYTAYRRAVRAWIPRRHPWTPQPQAAAPGCGKGRTWPVSAGLRPRP